MVPVISLLVKESKIYALKKRKENVHYFFNVDSSYNIQDILLKFSEGIIDILVEGTVSQISHLGTRSSFYAISKMMLKDFRKCFPFFDIT